MRTRRRILLVAIPVLVLLITVSVASRLLDRGARWLEISREPLVRRVAASGELRSSNPLSVGCPSIRGMWQFTITRLTPEGKHVQQGVPLVGFDAKELVERREVKASQLETATKERDKTRLEQQEALADLKLSLAEAKAGKARLTRKLEVPARLRARIELDKLRLEAQLADREIEILGKQVDTQRDNMRARIGAAEQRVQALEREVAAIGKQIGRMTVKAQRAGYVVHRPDWRGDKPKVGESVWSGRTLMEIADLSQMEVSAEIGEPDAGFVEVGQRVEIRLDAAPERTFTGRIVGLGRLFRTKSWDVPSRVFDATVAIDEPDPDLMRPGMAADLVILAPSSEQVVQIPEEALRYTEQGIMVELQDPPFGSEMRPVVLGERWEGQVVVEDGLEPGDRIALPGGET
jgi:HlyD family secretion protein